MSSPTEGNTDYDVHILQLTDERHPGTRVGTTCVEQKNRKKEKSSQKLEKMNLSAENVARSLCVFFFFWVCCCFVVLLERALLLSVECFQVAEGLNVLTISVYPVGRRSN